VAAVMGEGALVVRSIHASLASEAIPTVHRCKSTQRSYSAERTGYD
jgi:hypothetical protein